MYSTLTKRSSHDVMFIVELPRSIELSFNPACLHPVPGRPARITSERWLVDNILQAVLNANGLQGYRGLEI